MPTGPYLGYAQSKLSDELTLAIIIQGTVDPQIRASATNSKLKPIELVFEYTLNRIRLFLIRKTLASHVIGLLGRIRMQKIVSGYLRTVNDSCVGKATIGN